MSVISVMWTLFRSPSQWDKSDLDYILRTWDQLFKSLGGFRYLEIVALSQELENKKYGRNYIWGRFSISCRDCK